MKKIFCDACLEEVDRPHSFKYLCHLDPYNRTVLGHVDRNGNRISSREDHKDLCIKCYNRIMGQAVKEFEKIVGEN